MSWEPIRWQDVKGLPEGARVQNNKQAKVTSAFSRTTLKAEKYTLTHFPAFKG